MYFNAEYDGKKGPICPKDCPKREVGCHDAGKCERWADHERKKTEAYRKRREGISGEVRHKIHKK